MGICEKGDFPEPGEGHSYHQEWDEDQAKSVQIKLPLLK
jgi:hypothetical protein